MTPRERALASLEVVSCAPGCEDCTGQLDDLIIRLCSLSNQLLNSYHTTDFNMNFRLLKERVGVLLYRYYKDYIGVIPEGINGSNCDHASWVIKLVSHARRAIDSYARGSLGDAQNEIEVMFGIVIKVLIVVEQS